MKKRFIAGSIFAAGLAIGAIASEVAVNGLHVFKSGNPIVASEVNANFSLLMQKVSALEAQITNYGSNTKMQIVPLLANSASTVNCDRA